MIFFYETWLKNWLISVKPNLSCTEGSINSVWTKFVNLSIHLLRSIGNFKPFMPAPHIQVTSRPSCRAHTPNFVTFTNFFVEHFIDCPWLCMINWHELEYLRSIKRIILRCWQSLSHCASPTLSLVYVRTHLKRCLLKLLHVQCRLCNFDKFKTSIYLCARNTVVYLE